MIIKRILGMNSAKIIRRKSKDDEREKFKAEEE